MTLLHPRIEPTHVDEPDAEALIQEARRLRRRRWAIATAAVLIAGGLAAGLLASVGGSPPRRPSSSTTADNGGRPAAVSPAHLVARGNGIASAQFGQPEAVAISELKKTLGSPEHATPTNMAGNCTIDAGMSWQGLTAYFFHGRFVGYGTGSLLGGPGYRTILNMTTASGLRIGDPLTKAKRLYGSALATSGEQGGAWFASTTTGRLAGLLTGEVNVTSPAPRIADITAGSVGCPAASP